MIEYKIFISQTWSELKLYPEFLFSVRVRSSQLRSDVEPCFLCFSFFVQGFIKLYSLFWEKIFNFRYSFPHSHFSSSQYFEKFVNPEKFEPIFLWTEKNSCSGVPLKKFIYLVRVDFNTGWDRVCFPHLIFYLDITVDCRGWMGSE